VVGCYDDPHICPECARSRRLQEQSGGR
jgi:hypothetical protein